MKIWFDLSNSPHINLFHDLILDLESEGHEIIITSRPLSNTIALLDKKKLKYTIIGKHYGKSLIKKIAGYPIRIFQLFKFLKKIKPDVAISQSSFHSPLTAKLLGIRSIYTNDNEHASGNLIAFHFATKILLPENIDLKNLSLNKNIIKKIFPYPGLKEGIYLWKLSDKINKKRNNIHEYPFKIFFRPEPQTAQYYHGKINFMDETLTALLESNKYEVTVFPRDPQQIEHYKQLKFKNISLSLNPVELNDIASDCDLFIGAGGSMTRELAILGIPVISVYQEKLLEVDKYLVQQKLITHDPFLTIQKIEQFISSIKRSSPSIELMNKGKLAYSFFKNEILNLNIS